MRALARDQAPIAAGLAFAAFGVFGALPVALGLALSLGLDAETTTAWIFSISVGSGLATIPLVLLRREPYSIGFNVPAAIVLASAAATYGWPAVLGACALSGLVIAALALAGLGRASMRFIPLPLVMGLFAGSILRLATGVFEQLGGEEPLVAAAAVAGYFATRLLTRDRVPATLGSLVLGLAAVAAVGRLPSDIPLALTLPRLAVPAFDLGAFAALVLPIVLLVVGTGNVQALGFLRAQGYRPPADRLTLVVGLMTTAQALFGGTPAGMARVGAALVGGPEAGPRERRWIASLIAAVVFVIVGLLAVPVAAAALELPRSFVTTVAGLAILGALLDALRIVFTSRLAYSGFFALLIAFSPLAPLGLESAFWALVGSMAIAALFERDALRDSLRQHRDAVDLDEDRRPG